MVVTLKRILDASRSTNLLGLGTTPADRALTIDYIERALEIAAYKANWDPWIGTMDVCSDCCGYVTLPYEVGTVLAANIGGWPASFRNSWFEYHINGPGDRGPCCGLACNLSWADRMWTPTFQQLTDWSLVAAIVEDPIDGNSGLEIIVEGQTMDAGYNQKMALTIPALGPSLPGVRLPLLNGYASTDAAVTYFKEITNVTKPVTRGYVKLIGFQPTQLSNAVTIGYYAPHETNPRYRRLKVSCACQWVRIKFRRTSLALVQDYDVLPISSYQATIDLLKAIRLRETGNIVDAEAYELKAIQLLSEIQSIEDGPNYSPIQFDPLTFGIGTIDYR